MFIDNGNRILIFFLLLLGIAAYGCRSDKKNKNGNTTIRGNVQFPVHDKIYFYSYSDTAAMYLDSKSPLDSVTVSKNGDYSFVLSLTKPMVFNITYGNENLVTNLFIMPGNELTINFSGKNNLPQIPPFSEESKYNNYLIKFLNQFYLDPLAKQQYYIVSNYMDLDQFISYNNERKQSQLRLFNETFRNDSLKKEFRDYALSTISYGIAVDRLMYVWKKRMKGEHVVPDSSYFSFETPEFIENRNALSCPSYVRFLNLYNKEMYERKVEKGEFPADEQHPVIPQVEKYKLAMRWLNKPYRDVVLYNLVNADLNNVSEKKPNSINSTSMDSLLVSFTRKYSLN
jgi:hypothetical protein